MINQHNSSFRSSQIPRPRPLPHHFHHRSPNTASCWPSTHSRVTDVWCSPKLSLTSSSASGRNKHSGGPLVASGPLSKHDYDLDLSSILIKLRGSHDWGRSKAKVKHHTRLHDETFEVKRGLGLLVGYAATISG